MQSELWLAQAILAFHILIIAFNVFGLIAIPLGAWRGWRWVRIFWWRVLHLAALLVVAVQALLGTACFLTIWQSELQEAAGLPSAPDPDLDRSSPVLASAHVFFHHDLCPDLDRGAAVMVEGATRFALAQTMMKKSHYSAACFVVAGMSNG